MVYPKGASSDIWHLHTREWSGAHDAGEQIGPQYTSASHCLLMQGLPAVSLH
jgi:hypothetical protein